MSIKGTIVKSTGSWYDVRINDGSIVPSRILGKFRKQNKKLTNPVAVGDHVLIKRNVNEDTASIVEILDRRNYVIRQSPRKKHFLHVLAANIDQAILIVTIVEPMLKQGFIDRFLLMTEPYDIPVHIVFNKSDLYSEEDLTVYGYLKHVYEKIGYQCHLSSYHNQDQITSIKELLANKTSLIAGQSGVGKSTLVNYIDTNIDLKTQVLSESTGKGQHTTTFAEMYPLQFGGDIIDTPGIKTLSFNHLEVQDVAHNFREFFLASEECKFSDCTHRNEPKCAVKEKIENDEISELRYANYLTIIGEIEEQNYWEIHSKDY